MSAARPTHPTVAALAAELAAGRASARELAVESIARARRHAGLGTFLAIDEVHALAEADAADARRARGDAGPLTGVPIGHKDIFVTDHARTALPTTAGSRMLEGYRSPFDATVVARLAQAGAVTIGKLNCDEFAMGSSNENSAFGRVLNPWDPTRVPGGSSGGSAAAVAAGLLPAATGTRQASAASPA